MHIYDVYMRGIFDNVKYLGLLYSSSASLALVQRTFNMLNQVFLKSRSKMLRKYHKTNIFCPNSNVSCLDFCKVSRVHSCSKFTHTDQK